MRKTPVLFVACLFLGACANQGKVREQEMARIGDWLPGRYHNAAQVDEDLQKPGAAVQPSMELNIVPVLAPFLGEHVLFVERIDLTKGRRTVAQQLYRFDKAPDMESVVQRIFELKEPQRWTRGATNPELFKSLMVEDVTAVPACDLKWSFDGDRFTGVAGRKGCSIRQMSFDGLELAVEQSGNPPGESIQFRRIDGE